MKSSVIYIILICFPGIFNIVANLSAGEILFNARPDWESSSMNHVATGLGVADINGDGWDDIIAANGNDILRQHLCVYYNHGDGTFPAVPSWTSADIDYNGHLAVGDINADNFPDVAVSVFTGPRVFVDPGFVKVYINTGAELESTPSFRSADSMFTFSCALGDADGDGDLDLAVAGGQAYAIGAGPYQTYGRVYYNENGVLERTPGWTSGVTMGALDVDFADMDGNGYLDLIFANHLTPNFIFLADDRGHIATYPGWKSLDENYYANSLTLAYITDDPFPDLIVSDNKQLGGEGKFKAYFFKTGVRGKTYPSWTSNSGGYGSAVIAEDLNDDGLIDLAAGRWWGSVQVFGGIENNMSPAPVWISASNSVIEAFALRDLDQDGWETKSDTLKIEADSVHTVYLLNASVERLLQIKRNNEILQPAVDYCHVQGANWISMKRALIRSDVLLITYIISNDRDLIVSNWDKSKGNYIFYNQRIGTSITHYGDVEQASGVRLYPNPFNSSCNFIIHSSTGSGATLQIYNVMGQLMRQIETAANASGFIEIRWDGENEFGIPVASGVYLYQVHNEHDSFGGKLMLIR